MADRREIYELADLRLDVGRQRLTHDDREIPLPKLSFNLLVALVRAAPNVMSIDELMSVVWPGLIVNSETVVQRVKMLRDALGDDPRAPRYIGGLRGRGYRIICPVAHVENLVDPDPARMAESPAASGRPDKTVESEPAAGRVRPRPWVLRPAPATAAALGVAIAALAVYSGVFTRGSGPPPSAPAPVEASVAVMAFKDLSPEGSAGYIALGVPEMILDRLASVPGLVVIARDSSFALDPASKAIDAGRQLKARWLVTGGVQRVGNSLRITTQMLDPETSEQLWSHRFDGTVDRIFVLQEEIAGRVADAIRERVSGVPALRAARPVTRSPEAYLLYLEGRSRLARWTVADAEAAAKAFDRATRLDPNFAAAYASLYDARMMAAERRMAGVDQARDANQHLVDRAMSLDPDNGAAYFARAIWAGRNDDQREADFSMGLRLDPSNGRGLTAYSEFLDRQGRPDEAAAMLERAMRVDPLSPRARFRMVMRGFGSREMATQEALLLEVLERDPNYVPALQRYAKYRWQLRGRLAEAAATIERAVAVDPENPWIRYTAACIYLDLDDPDAAATVVSRSAVSASAGRLLQALRRGDTPAAGQAALAGALSVFNLHESWGEVEAIRDQALASGDLQPAIRYLEHRYSLAGTPVLTIENYRAATVLAQLLRASGDEVRSARLLEELVPAIDASIPKFGTVYALRTKAMVLMLRGERDAALAVLADSFRDGDYTQWWYTLDHDPLWQPVRHDPRFRTLDASVRANVASERMALEQLRADGVVPAYLAAATAAPSSG